MLRKKDGGFGYDSTDLCAIDVRVNEWNCKWVIYVVGSEQELHFDLIFKGAKKAELIDDNIKLIHAGFGMMLGEDGKKMKTRSGDTIKLKDLINDAQEQAYKGLLERYNSDEGTGTKVEDDKLKEASLVIGISSIK